MGRRLWSDSRCKKVALTDKILVIEDEESVRLNLAELLEAEGYQCVVARDGEEGVRAAWDELPDLIICDVLMPQLDGFGVLARLAQDPATAFIPFIFLTALGERKDQRTGMELGADDYVTKPFSRLEILNAVEKRLGKRSEAVQQMRRALLSMQTRLTTRVPEDFLTPLSLILGAAETLMSNSAVRSDPEQVRGTAEAIARAARRLIESLENYLQITDLDLMVADATRKDQLLGSVVEQAGWEIEGVCKITARKHNREGDLSLQVGEACLMIHRDHLEKLVEALLDNAFLYSEPASPVRVVGRVREGNIYHLQVTDGGRGMYPEQVANLVRQTEFDRLRFVETHTGLGWTLVQKLVDLYGGKVNLSSRVGQGTTVDLELRIKGS